MSSSEVNDQHLAAMGISEIKLGEQQVKTGPSQTTAPGVRCGALHPNNLQVQCILLAGHTTRHVRGSLHWTDEPVIPADSTDFQKMYDLLDNAWLPYGSRHQILVGQTNALLAYLERLNE